MPLDLVLGGVRGAFPEQVGTGQRAGCCEGCLPITLSTSPRPNQQ